MSLTALKWALDKEIFHSTRKLVLVVLANYASETGKSYPQVSTICKKSSLHDETVRGALKALVFEGIIKDTGKRFGPTQQVKVYQLPPEACDIEDPGKPGSSIEDPEKTPENRGLQKSRKYDSRPGEDPEKTPENRGLTLEPLKSTLLKKERGERNGFKKPEVEEVKLYCVQIGLTELDGEIFFEGKQGNGWKNGHSDIKDWRATIRNWKLNNWMPSQKNGHKVAAERNYDGKEF